MPLTGNARGFGQRLMRAGVAIDTHKAATLQRASLIAKRELEASRNRATGGDGVLSGVGRSGGRLGVTFQVNGTTATMRATGPWQLVENNTSPHVIRPKRAQALSFGPGFVRASAMHPGTRGKKPWAIGSKAAQAPVAQALQHDLRSVVKAVL